MYHALPGTFSDEEIREARLLLGIIVEEELWCIMSNVNTVGMKTTLM
jgi:hypothetical protein